MDGVRWARGAHHIADSRTGNPDLRSAAENRTIPYLLRRSDYRREEFTRGTRTIGEDEYTCVHAGENVTAYGSDRRV